MFSKKAACRLSRVLGASPAVCAAGVQEVCTGAVSFDPTRMSVRDAHLAQHVAAHERRRRVSWNDATVPSVPCSEHQARVAPRRLENNSWIGGNFPHASAVAVVMPIDLFANPLLVTGATFVAGVATSLTPCL